MAASRRRSLFNGIIYGLNIIAGLALLASYLAYYVPPSSSSIFAFLALSYPVLLLINILFVLYWAIRVKAKIVFSVLCIVIGYLHFNRFYQLGSSETLVTNDPKLKVMSYNVRMFNAYQWIPEEGIPEKIRLNIEKERPDVLLMQEYYLGDITPQLNFKYSFVKPTNISSNYGLTLHSNFPIIETGTLELMDLGSDKPSYNNQFIYADIDWNGDIIRFINIHLASVGLEASDYQRLQNPNEGSQEEIKNGFTKIFKQLDKAFVKRSKQVVALKRAINSSPHPVVVCGDFNDTPQSYTYHQVDLLLDDAFMEQGEGFGKTYARGPIPFRIDHIFYSDSLKAYSYKVGEEKLSDHFPVISELGFK